MRILLILILFLMTTKSNNKVNSNLEPSIGSWSGDNSTASQSNHFNVSNFKYDPHRLKLILMLEAQQKKFNKK